MNATNWLLAILVIVSIVRPSFCGNPFEDGVKRTAKYLESLDELVPGREAETRRAFEQIKNNVNMEQEPEALMADILAYVDREIRPNVKNEPDLVHMFLFKDLTTEDKHCYLVPMAQYQYVITQMGDSEVFGPFEKLMRFYLPSTLNSCWPRSTKYLTGYRRLAEFLERFFMAGLSLEEETDRAKLASSLREVDWNRQEDIKKILKNVKRIERKFPYYLKADLVETCENLRKDQNSRVLLAHKNLRAMIGVEQPEDFEVEADLLNEYNRFCRAFEGETVRCAVYEVIDGKEATSCWSFKLGRKKN